jgi:hypothetical protein
MKFRITFLDIEAITLFTKNGIGEFINGYASNYNVTLAPPQPGNAPVSYTVDLERKPPPPATK